MLRFFDVKNIPSSISILHEQEYHNLCNMLQLKRKRRAYTDRLSVRERIKVVTDPPISNTQTFRLEEVV